MSATDVRVPVRNGAIRSRPAPRRPAGTRPKAKSAAEKLAPFAAVRAEPINTEMWPLHPVLWLHPELAPGLPCSSGLTIEHCCKVPAPDFLYLEVKPAPGAPDRAQECNPLPPELPQQLPLLPQSDLTLLGWDPRVVCMAKGGDQ